MTLKIGDTVKVIDSGCNYTQYTDWTTEYNINYIYIGTYPKNGDVGVVTHIAPHLLNTLATLCAVDINGHIFVIGEEGLELVNIAPAFAVGDRVKVISKGATYTNYAVWAKAHHLDDFHLGHEPANGDIGVVVRVGPHLDLSSRLLFGVSIGSNDFIIGENGLELLPAQELKEGDKVRVIDIDGVGSCFTLGEIVTVKFLDSNDFDSQVLVYVHEHEGCMYARRFELAEPVRSLPEATEPTIYFTSAHGQGGKYRLEWVNGKYLCLLRYEIYGEQESYAEYTAQRAQGHFDSGAWVIDSAPTYTNGVDAIGRPINFTPADLKPYMKVMTAKGDIGVVLESNNLLCIKYLTDERTWDDVMFEDNHPSSSGNNIVEVYEAGHIGNVFNAKSLGKKVWTRFDACHKKLEAEQRAAEREKLMAAITEAQAALVAFDTNN